MQTAGFHLYKIADMILYGIFAILYIVFDILIRLFEPADKKITLTQNEGKNNARRH